MTPDMIYTASLSGIAGIMAAGVLALFRLNNAVVGMQAQWAEFNRNLREDLAGVNRRLERLEEQAMEHRA